MSTSTLLPTGDGLQIVQVTSTADKILIDLTMMATSAVCPVCQHASTRIHSRYPRTLSDLPWNRVAVQINVQARKFFCDQSTCPRRIFTEPLPELAARYARKTNRLHHALYLLGYALGGEAGARLAVSLGLLVSPNTLLRRIRQVAAAATSASTLVRVLGVDDFAFRKGQRYGTILVDLERRRVLDLLPDRAAQTLADWLKAHPEVEIVSRDRASAYAEAVRQAAPHAKQVADRFHLLKNVGDMLERLLCRRYKQMRDVMSQMAVAAKSAAAEGTTQDPQQPQTPEATLPSANPMTRLQQQSACRQERRRLRYERVLELRQQKLSVRAIARKTGLSRNTLRKWLDAGCFVEHAKRSARRSKLAPFADYLQTRWEEGVQNATLLYEEVKAQGYEGSINLVQRYVLPWRKLARGQPRPHRDKPPSSRTVMWWLLGHVSKDAALRQKQTAFVERLTQHCPDVKTSQELALRFTAMVKQQHADQLNGWLNDAAQTSVAELRNFARSLRQDYAAVKEALSSPYSNGQVEGQVNRLKLVKRSMYGRASFDLLRARVLPMR